MNRKQQWGQLQDRREPLRAAPRPWRLKAPFPRHQGNPHNLLMNRRNVKDLTKVKEWISMALNCTYWRCMVSMCCSFRLFLEGFKESRGRNVLLQELHGGYLSWPKNHQTSLGRVIYAHDIHIYAYLIYVLPKLLEWRNSLTTFFFASFQNAWLHQIAQWIPKKRPKEPASAEGKQATAKRPELIGPTSGKGPIKHAVFGCLWQGMATQNRTLIRIIWPSWVNRLARSQTIQFWKRVQQARHAKHRRRRNELCNLPCLHTWIYIYLNLNTYGI